MLGFGGVFYNASYLWSANCVGSRARLVEVAGLNLRVANLASISRGYRLPEEVMERDE